MSDVQTFVKYDESEDKLHINRVQDVEPIIEHVKTLKDGYKGSDIGHYVGTIPAVIVEQYLIECGIDFGDFMKDDTHIKRILTNPDFKKFRVWEGRF